MIKKVNNKYYIQTKLIARAGDPKEFERLVNEFAKTHTVIGIKYQSFVVNEEYDLNSGVPTMARICDRALIMYKVYEEADASLINELDTQAEYVRYLQRKLDQHNITYRTRLNEEVPNEKV